MKIEKIVLATDFSPSARGALDHAVAIAARFGARLYLFHVVSVQDSDGAHVLGNETRIDDFYELAEQRAREELTALRLPGSGASESAISIVESVRIGAPADEVVAFAEEKGADLIVAGTRGRTGIWRVLVGSVAETVLRHAPCAVLAVRVPDRAATTERRPGFGKVLVAVDGSESSRAALRLACRLASRFDGSVTVASIVDDHALAQAVTLSQLDAFAIESRFREGARDSLDRCIAEALGEPGRAHARRVEVGRPAEAIARLAQEMGADLVACGTHGRSGLSRALFGSVAERIVRIAPCPVLTVREGRPAARLAA